MQGRDKHKNPFMQHPPVVTNIFDFELQWLITHLVLLALEVAFCNDHAIQIKDCILYMQDKSSRMRGVLSGTSTDIWVQHAVTPALIKSLLVLSNSQSEDSRSLITIQVICRVRLFNGEQWHRTKRYEMKRRVVTWCLPLQWQKVLMPCYCSTLGKMLLSLWFSWQKFPASAYWFQVPHPFAVSIITESRIAIQCWQFGA